ncbi:unnamed protein product [Cyprideis torosa]|uniref:Uncharacterized protein n=1 Tax=Cyprideis torosa TaxID=163714 RepID=A0A7R8ZIY4_9CRUS|nr:unnamed protein product [Cyprideis torosa]CAG0887350.1 unnamed protein product [Cyprideis torosa]
MMGEHDDRMGGAGQGTTVIMVYGMNPEKMNCQRLFNLLCMYGNVNKIKFLKTKEGCAMVEVPDSMAAERMMANISGRDAFGSTLSVGFSKQSFIADVRQPYELPDGSESFATYTNSKNNRFTTPELAMKNRIMPPTKHLHFYNVPPGFSEADIKQLFSADEEDGGTKTGYSPEVKLFETKSERTARGILTFNTIEDATECCIMYNHKSIENPGGRFPYTMKLAFTGAGRGGGPRNN